MESLHQCLGFHDVFKQYTVLTIFSKNMYLW